MIKRNIIALFIISTISILLMAADYPSLTYTFSSNELISETKIMKNYNDLLNALKDGTKKININEVWISNKRVIDSNRNISANNVVVNQLYLGATTSNGVLIYNHKISGTTNTNNVRTNGGVVCHSISTMDNPTNNWHFLKMVPVSIGTWNMNSNLSKTITHNLNIHPAAIRGVLIGIRNDDETIYSNLQGVNLSGVTFNSTSQISIAQSISSNYRTTDYDKVTQDVIANPYNRGVLMIYYNPSVNTYENIWDGI